jgi:arylsulfatase A-like enzyme
VPFFVQWKGKLAGGKTYENPVMNLDILPTVVTAAGGKVEAGWNLDGVDLTPYLTGANAERPHQTIYWRYGDQWAIRDGDWKLVVSKGGSGKPELYDLSRDRSESNDLASAETSKVAKLQKMWDAWSAEQAEPTAKDDQSKKQKNQKKRTADRKAKRGA